MKPTPIDQKNLRQTNERIKKKSVKMLSSAQIETSSPKGSPAIELFQREDCPHSHAVRNRLSQLGVDYIAHTVPKGNAFKHELLAQAGGKDQIPFLIDRKSGVKLYDSDKIISYLEHEFGRPAPARISELTRNVALRIQARSDELAWALRQPFERARSLVDDMSDSLKVLRDSYQSVRRALTQPAAAEERASTHKAA